MGQQTADMTDFQLAFTLNGKPRSIAVDHQVSLLGLLRDQLAVTSPKNGCEPQAQCGCCTVLVDGKPRLSCTLPAHKAHGKAIVTCEGLAADIRRDLAGAFVEAGGIQCGFCIPGIAIRAAALIDRNPDPSREEIAKDLRSHLCRCTGYTKILDAIELYARRRRGGRSADGAVSGRVGTPLPRYTGAEAVLGDRKYIDDMFLGGMLFAAATFSEYPRALVRSIDAGEAESYPGVERVLMAKDVPGNRFVGLITRDWPVFLAVGEETRCVGDLLAVVVADSMRAAREAAALVRVDYEVRDPVTDPRDALKPDAPRIHSGGNLLSRSAVIRGDVQKALAQSAHVVEHEFATQRIEHLYLEPEACLVCPTQDGGFKMFTQGQGVFDDRRQVCDVIGLPAEKLHVELVSNGGAFGGKEDMSIQAQTALAAMLCGRPVKMVLTREESFRLHPKRHPIRMHYRVGCDAEGRLTAVWARMIGDKGAYASVGAKVLERAAGHGAGPYRVDNVDIEALAVYTNNPPCGAMRGFGANQSAFAIEACMDMLAEKVGIDGWEMRWRNVLDVGDTFATGQKLTKLFGLKKTLLAVKEQYRAAKYAGIGCGIKNVGIGNGMVDEGKAVLRVEHDGTITIRTGFTEMGQGLFTVLIQTAVEETGLPPSRFNVITDTAVDVNCGQTTASRGTVLGCHAVKIAAQKLKAELARALSLPRLAGKEYRGEWACNWTHKLGAHVENPVTHLTFGFATQVVMLNDDGTLKKVIAAHDVGRVMNPTLLAGQIEGSIHMGLGYALTEDFECEGGYPTAEEINDCGVLRAHHMPEVEVIFVEEPDPDCPYGAKGVGEIGLVPTAGAVNGALYAFDKKRRFSLPMKDAPAARAIWNPRWKPGQV